MRPSHLKKTVSLLYKSPKKRPVSIWGPPGVGKTDVVMQSTQLLSRELGHEVNYWELNLTCHDQGDLKFPVVVGERIKWVCSLLPDDPSWRGIVCLDELGQCDTAVQKAVCQLLLARRIGEYRLPDEAMVVCTSNRAEDRAGVTRLITPILGRLYHYDFSVSTDDWQEWAVGYGIDHRVRSFVQYKEKLLLDFKPEENQRSFPSPRGFMYASDALQAMEQDGADQLMETFEGCVGKAVAGELHGWLDLYDVVTRRFPIDRILADPDSVDVPRLNEGSVLFALAGTLVERGRCQERPVVHNAMRYILRMPLEYAAYGLRNMIHAATSKLTLTAPGASQFVKAHENIIFSN